MNFKQDSNIINLFEQALSIAAAIFRRVTKKFEYVKLVHEELKVNNNLRLGTVGRCLNRDERPLYKYL